MGWMTYMYMCTWLHVLDIFEGCNLSPMDCNTWWHILCLYIYALIWSNLSLLFFYTEPINFDSDSSRVEKLLTFGRHLQTLYTEITQDQPNKSLQTLLQDSFSLLAYKNPHNSPVSYLLQLSQREADTANLNSAILSKHTCTCYGTHTVNNMHIVVSLSHYL